MAAVPESLHPIVTALRQETILVPFTDYSQWERKHQRGSVALHTPQTAQNLSPLQKRSRKTCKSTAPESKKRSSIRTTSAGAKVRLQPLAVCSHGQGVRRRFPAISISETPQVHKGQTWKSPEKQPKSSRLGRSHEPTSIRLLRVSGPIINYSRFSLFLVDLSSPSSCTAPSGCKKELSG